MAKFEYKPRIVEVYKWDGNLGNFRKWCNAVGARSAVGEEPCVYLPSWSDEPIPLRSDEWEKTLSGQYIVWDDEELHAWSPARVAERLRCVEKVDVEALVEIDECGNVMPVPPARGLPKPDA